MRFLLVGTTFTPGAQAIIAKGLGQGARVTLIAEAENPYDTQAVRVFVAQSEVIPSAELDAALVPFGLSVDTIRWPLQLGHLGAKATTKAAKTAQAEGHRFELCAEWHVGGAPPHGRLIQHGNGTNLIECDETKECTK